MYRVICCNKYQRNINISVGLTCRQAIFQPHSEQSMFTPIIILKSVFKQSPVVSTIQIKQRSETSAPSAYTPKMSLRLENWITHQLIWFFITNLIKIMGN